MRERKAPLPLCNCSATVQLYDKRFPHRAGSVLGCHMGPDGRAKDGAIRPGCNCKACELMKSYLGWGDSYRANMDGGEELWGSLDGLRKCREIGKDLDGAFNRWQHGMVGVEV